VITGTGLVDAANFIRVCSGNHKIKITLVKLSANKTTLFVKKALLTVFHLIILYHSISFDIQLEKSGRRVVEPDAHMENFATL